MWPLLLAAAATSPWVGEFRVIPAGTFRPLRPPHDPNPVPLGEVTLSAPFLLMDREVTGAMWQQVMGAPPPDGAAADDLPVSVSWREARRFAARLTTLDPAHTWRLPTSAEWEHAARAGEAGTPYAGGADLVAVGWSALDAEGHAHPGCLKARNPWGLCDMTGNVGEWVADGPRAPSASAVTDPVGDLRGPWRLIRGGSWFEDEVSVQLSILDGERKGDRRGDVGFRLVATPRPGEAPPARGHVASHPQARGGARDRTP